MNILLDKQVFDHITGHAEEEYPEECCGFFFGKEMDKRRTIFRARGVNNAKEGDRSRRYYIAPEDYRKAEEFASDKKLDFLGVYHSHPDHPAEASEHDRKVAMPYFSYIIVSVRDGKSTEIRSWQLNEDRRFEEEAIEIKNLNIEPVNR